MNTKYLLYERLEQELKDMVILNMNDCIACPIQESGYLNDDSICFHSRLVFSEVGRFHDSGYKFNQWFDMVWMEKMIGSHDARPADVRWRKEQQ